MMVGYDKSNNYLTKGNAPSVPHFALKIKNFSFFNLKHPAL
jgi:hypothetical protein